MKLERFFEKFELFAEAPDAVARMREVVLDFAISGRLVASEAEWPRHPLKSLATKIGSGATPAGGRNAYCDEGIPLIRSMNVHFGGFDRTGLVFLNNEQADKLSNVIVQTDDVLLNITGASIGRVTIAPNDMAGARVNQHVTIIRSTSELSPRFLTIFLASPSIQRMIAEVQVGATRQALTKAMIEQFEIPLPPLAEQKRIVAKVEELMALCDQLEAQQQERQTRHAALVQASLARFTQDPTPANLQLLFHPSYTVSPADLRKTILTLAVQGKLVPQDPKDEPAPTSFPGLKPVISESDEKVPQPWMVCRYRELTSLVTSGSRGWKEFYSEKGAVFIRTQNIKTDTLILDDVAFVDLPKSVEGLRTQVEKDDILITITGANVTKAARVEEQIAEAYVSQHIALTRPRWSSMSKWLHLCFISDGAARGQLAELAYGDKPGLNLNNIRELIFPVPPLAEQRRIVAKVEELLALVDELETQLVASRTVAQNLLAALVRELTTTP